MITPIPTIEQLEEEHKKRNLYIKIIFWSVFIFSIFASYQVFYVLGISNYKSLFSLFCVLLILKHCFDLSFLYYSIIDFNLYDKENLGNFKKQEIKELFDEIFLPLNKEKGEVPKIFILKNEKSIIMVVNVLVLNWIKKLNCIYISENVFQILNRSELKAALLHEIAHFTKYSTIFNRFPFILIYMQNIIALLICMLLNLNILLAIPLYIILFFVVQIIINFLIPPVYKIHEYLCDYYAAKRVDTINMINSLLRLCRTLDNEYYIYKKLYKMTIRSKDINMEDIFEIAKILNERLPQGIFSKKSINAFIKKELDKYRNEYEVVGFLDNNAIKERNEKMRKFLSNFKGQKNPKVISWKEFEINKVDYRIDQKEYPYLIDLLKKDMNRQLVEILIDNIAFSNDYSHPILKERILFLDKNLPALKIKENP